MMLSERKWKACVHFRKTFLCFLHDSKDKNGCLLCPPKTFPRIKRNTFFSSRKTLPEKNLDVIFTMTLENEKVLSLAMITVQK